MNTSILIEDVSDTSFWVAYYRAKETERPDALFQDSFAKSLVGDRGQRFADSMPEISRYTEWSVITRTVIIDRFIEQLIKDGVDAVNNLGAGLDARPYRMNLPEKLQWVEVDHSNIIAHKNEVLKLEIPKCKLARIQLDLAHDKERRAFFENVVPQAKKVLILTEGVIPYLSPEEATELAKDLLKHPRFTYWITEYFHQKVYRHLKSTVRTLKMKNAPFKFYPEDWFSFFKNLGWVEKETRYPSEIAKEFKRKPPMPKWVALLVPFLPKRAKAEVLRLNGYVVFKRSS